MIKDDLRRIKVVKYSRIRAFLEKNLVVLLKATVLSKLIKVLSSSKKLKFLHLS